MNKYKKSLKCLEKARRYFAGGVGSNARFNLDGPTLFFERGKGSKIYDVDGNEFIDYILAWGPLILGHCPSVVIEAVKKQLEYGTMFGAGDPQEEALAHKVCDCFPSVDKVRFTNSSTEAVQMSLRLARAYTGKSKILKFEGAYHGWIDNINVSSHPDSLKLMGLENNPFPLRESGGQCKNVLEEILVASWNRFDIVEKIIQKHSNEIAALILEPIMCNNGVIPPNNGFLTELREITRENEIVLIFDETITGFRINLGGAQKYYNISPDMTVFGKGMGGGYPIAGYGGRKEIMNLVAEGKVPHGGTYNSNSLCVAAALAVLNEFSKNNGSMYNKITSIGKKLMQGIEKIFLENNIPVILQGPGPFFSTLFTDKPVENYRDTFRLNRSLYSIFWVKLLNKGIRIWPSARGLWYISDAHTIKDIDITLQAVKDVVKTLKQG